MTGENKILGSLGISFITLFAAMVSINRFVQLTVILQSPAGAASQDLARFLPYSTGSVMFALEMLGWGFVPSPDVCRPAIFRLEIVPGYPLALFGLCPLLFHERDRLRHPDPHYRCRIHRLGTDPAGPRHIAGDPFLAKMVRALNLPSTAENGP